MSKFYQWMGSYKYFLYATIFFILMTIYNGVRAVTTYNVEDNSDFIFYLIMVIFNVLLFVVNWCFYKIKKRQHDLECTPINPKNMEE